MQGGLRSEELEILNLAIERRLLTQEQAAACCEHATPEKSLLVALVERGLLNEKQVHDLQMEHRKRRPQVYLPDEARAAKNLPGREFGKYILCQILARGPNGTRWKAFDTHASRFVALKMLDGVRFDRIPALQHPAIAQIYETGAIDGKDFVAAQYVEGVPFDRARLQVPSVLEIGALVALALDHAHSNGAVHRDVRPENILIETHKSPIPGSGRLLAVYLTDFGVPPHGPNPFEAPEGSGSAAADIYSLGATLYDVLTGQPPDTSLDNPVPPSRLNPKLDRNTDLVLLKALARDPARRYATARELALELQRCSKGAPVEAMAPSIPDQLVQRVRAKPALYGALLLGAVLTGAAVALLFWLVHSSEQNRRARQQQEQLKLQEADQQRKKAIEEAARRKAMALLSEFDAACSGPQQDLTKLYGRLDEARRLCEDLLSSHPLDIAAVHHVLGLIEIRRGNYEAAHASLEEAVGRRREPAFLLDLGRVDLELARRLAAKSAFASVRERETFRREAEQRRQDALRHLTGCGNLPFAEVLGALAARDAVRALSAADRLPEDAQVWKLRGDAYLDVRRDADRAKDCYRRAFELRPCFHEAVFGYGAAALQKAALLMGELRDPSKELDQAINAFETVTRLKPDSLEGWFYLGLAFARKVEYLAGTGQDPSADAQAALDTFRRVLEKDPRSAASYLQIGQALAARIDYLLASGGDPGEDFDSAIEAFGGAVRLDPDDPEAFLRKGRLHLTRINWFARKGKYSPSDIDAAMEAFDRCLQLAPGEVEGHAGLAEAWMQRGICEFANNEPAGASFDRAVEAAQRGLRVRERYTLYYTLGLVHHARAGYKLKKQEGADADFQDAIEALNRALTLNERHAPSYFLLSTVHLSRAAALESVGLDPAISFTEAIAVLDRVVALDPHLAQAWYERGKAYAAVARWHKRSGQSPAQALAAALADYERAAALSAHYAALLKGPMAELKKERGGQ